MPTARNERHRNKSLCEKSTEIAINITKLSSLYLARITLGFRGPAKGTQARMKAQPPALLAQDSKSKRLVEPEGNMITEKYLMEPDRGEESGGVDSRAAEFIRRIKEKNQKSDPGIHREVSKCIPPPPRVKWAKYYPH